MGRPRSAPGGTLEQFQSHFLGSSEAAQAVRKAIARAARVDATVLITGESGVGKELVAREIHALSHRRDGPFIPLNCAAIPETLLESELFGHEAGAFTDARGTRRGAFELAAGGSLFLDEVGDLSRAAQPKLLRALESGQVLRVGAEMARDVDVRIIAATNHDLRVMTREAVFRADLYFRLRVLEIHVPPLRERLQDVRDLAYYFARNVSRASRRPFSEISESALKAFEKYNWPGNVRELRSVIERAFAMSSGMVLDLSCFSLDPTSTPAPGLSLGPLLDQDWRTARDRFEATYASELLKRHGGNVHEAARAAGLAPRSLYKILQRLGLWRGPRRS